MEHKEEQYNKGAATLATEKSTEATTESKGVLGSVWSAAEAIAETVTHAVQGTIDAAYHTAERLQHDAEAVGTVGGYVAHQVADKASSVYGKVANSTLHTTETKATSHPTVDDFFSSPTCDLMEASRPQPTPVTHTLAETTIAAGEVAVAKASDAYESAKATVSDAVWKTVESAKQLTSDTVSYAVETAKHAAGDAIAKGQEILESAKPAIESAIESAKPTIESAKQVASAAIESTKPILENVKETASAVIESAKPALESAKEIATNVANVSEPAKFELTMDVVAHLQRIADRTGDAILHDTARKAHSACAKGLSDAQGVSLVRITPEQATELVNLAIMTQEHGLADFARYCQSVAATTQVGIEPYPGKIQEELAKGRQVLLQQGRVHTGPGYGAAFASANRIAPPAHVNSALAPANPSAPLTAPSSASMQLNMEMVAHLQRIADRTGDVVLHDTARKAHSACAKNLSEAPGVHLVIISPEQATELVNLAIRTQDHGLANFARYCQSVAATNQIGIEPSPGKIQQEINKGRQELSEGGRSHSGPGYGAAFASISRSTSQQNLLSKPLSRSNSNQNLTRSVSQQTLGTNTRSQPQKPDNLQLTMDVVAHLQRIADRTADPVLHETARRAHSAWSKDSSSAAPGVHLTYITPDQATELVNLAIRTQDHELANFARYCQSVASTTGVAVEPSPAKIQQEIEKGRQELQQQGRTHNGPGYGAAFASANKQQKVQAEPSQPAPSQVGVGMQ